MFHNIPYVYEVYKEKSFSKAAKNLYISQPSLSAAIKNIEQKILNYLYIVNIVKTNKQVELINCVRQIQAKKDKL